MRKNSPRKFIHAVLDVLPLLVIPIFALNILHKETEPISIEVGGYEYEEKYTSNILNTNNDLVVGNIYKLNLNGLISVNDTVRVFFSEVLEYDFETGIYGYSSSAYTIEHSPYLSLSTTETRLYISHTSTTSSFIIAGKGYAIVKYLDIDNPAFDITPYLTYTDYQEYEYVYNEEIVYDSTDIGSQFVYALYKPVHDYFNFNNLFNMGAIYNWIELNLFSGTAPLPIFIIWNIIVYEFFIDLIFLLYSVFMFIIDFADKMITTFMEKPLRR